MPRPLHCLSFKRCSRGLFRAAGHFSAAIPSSKRVRTSVALRTADLQPQRIGSIYHGRQIVLLGHYWGDGPAKITLRANVAGQDKQYKTRFNFPAQGGDNPELERLWAYATIQDMQREINYFGEKKDLQQGITDLGLEYGLVTNYTSMVVLRDAATAPRLLMGQRGSSASFMPNKVVFPGGAVDAVDMSVPLAMPLADRCSTRLAHRSEAAIGRGLLAAGIREITDTVRIFDADDGGMDIRLGSGRTLRAGLLIAADGVRSRLRGLVNRVCRSLGGRGRHGRCSGRG